MAKHPSKQLLSSWLDGEADLEEHDDEHINSCSRCASRLEKLSEIHLDNVVPMNEQFRPALMAVLQPPEDLHERISARIADRLQERDDATLFGSMLGVPVETTRIVTEPKIIDDEPKIIED